MSVILQFALGIGLVSFALTYAVWTRIRCLLLRQYVYDLRDEMFDRIAALGALSDPAYRKARVTCNALAPSTQYLTIPTVLYLILVTDDTDQVRTVASSDPAVQVIVDEMYGKLSRRLLRYLFLESLSGWVVSLFALLPLVVVRTTTKAMGEARMEKLVRSDVAGRLGGQPGMGLAH